MEVEDVLFQTIRHFFNLHQLVPVMLIEDALNAHCVGARPAKVLNVFFGMATAEDLANAVKLIVEHAQPVSCMIRRCLVFKLAIAADESD